MLAGLPADIGVAAAAFVGTNLDNALVTVAIVAASPPARGRRIVAGQVVGFAVLVLGAAATALALFELSARTIGLLGLVPLAVGVRGLVALRHADGRSATGRRAIGSGLISTAMVTVGAGGDNLAVYIPIFRVAGVTNVTATLLVFIAGEVLLTIAVLRTGRHPRVRAAVTRAGALATPILYCAVGLLVLWRAGTFSFLH